MSRDRGSASIYVLAVAAVVLLAGGVATVIGSAVVARHRAAVAADLAALAAAASSQSGAGPACALAGRVAAANGARLVRCRLLSADALVTAAVSPTLGGAWGAAMVTARAGPVQPGAPP